MTSDAVTAVLVLVPDAEPLPARVRRLAPELVRPLPAKGWAPVTA